MLNKFYLDKNYQYKNVAISIFFFIFFIVGLFIYDDYGISLDEEFHRWGGFYWLSHILSDPSQNLNPTCSLKFHDFFFVE